MSGFRLNQLPLFGVTVQHDGKALPISFDIALYDEGTNWEPSTGSIKDAEEITVFEDGAYFDFTLESRGTGTTHGVHDGEIEAPMPGKVTAVEVSQGEKVARGNACSRSRR